MVIQTDNAMEDNHRLQRCPYRQDLNLFCGERCGEGNASDCEIWMRYSGLLAQSIEEAVSNDD